jgi:hypothetical protein
VTTALALALPVVLLVGSLSVVDHLTGSVFAESLSVPASQLAATVDWGKRLAMVWDMLRDQVGIVGVVLALLGLLRLMIGRRWALLALTGLCYGVSVAFNMIYLIGDVHVLFIPSYLYVSLWMGLGVAALAQGVVAVTARLSHRPVTLRRSADEGAMLGPLEGERGSGVGHVTTALALALPVVLLVGSLSVVDQRWPCLSCCWSAAYRSWISRTIWLLPTCGNPS